VIFDGREKNASFLLLDGPLEDELLKQVISPCRMRTSQISNLPCISQRAPSDFCIFPIHLKMQSPIESGRSDRDFKYTDFPSAHRKNHTHELPITPNKRHSKIVSALPS
jgi:hypothetical protein